jgi:hypothetical protein
MRQKIGKFSFSKPRFHLYSIEKKYTKIIFKSKENPSDKLLHLLSNKISSSFRNSNKFNRKKKFIKKYIQGFLNKIILRKYGIVFFSVWI